MELRTGTQNLFRRFESTGSLGEGANRAKLGMMESMETVGYAMAADAAVRYDNSDIDSNPDPGLVRYDRAAFEAKITGELNQALPGLTQEPTLSKEEVDTLVQAGMLTKEEGQAMLEKTSPEAPKNGEAFGEVAKNGEELYYALETRGDENDFEIVKAGPGGLTYLNVKPHGDTFSATAYHVDGDGEGYKETLSGDWNLAG